MIRRRMFAVASRPWWATYLFAYLLIGAGAILVDAASRSRFALGMMAGIIAGGSGLVIFATAVAYSLRIAFSTMPRQTKRCPACNYNLTGNVSGVCPECGTPVAKATAEKIPVPPHTDVWMMRRFVGLIGAHIIASYAALLSVAAIAALAGFGTAAGMLAIIGLFAPLTFWFFVFANLAPHEPYAAMAVYVALGVYVAIFCTKTALSWSKWSPTPRIGHCPSCVYNLTGNTSGMCPECGTPVAGKARVMPYDNAFKNPA